jgi:hypothetical protein
MKPSIPIEEPRSRYEKLLPVPEAPGEREWGDRVTTFDHFLTMGPADLLDTACYFHGGKS